MDDLLIEQKLYEYLQVVNSYLVKMGASKEDAEDIVQDTAYKFILYIDSIDYKNVTGMFGAFIFYAIQSFISKAFTSGTNH